MGAGHDPERYARPLAEVIGVAADDVVVRYGVMSLSFLFLLVAAYVFGPAAQFEAIAVLLVALCLIFFIIYWWFLEEARKRRVMLLEEQPRPNDSHNPDLRDEVAFACVVLFIVTALLLQTINDTNLHYTVAGDVLGLKALICDARPDSFCAQNTRLFELPAWLFFTLQSFLTTIPMADQVGDYAANMTGVKPTAETPVYVATALRLIFGGLLFTIVIGSFQKVGRQIDSAIEALTLSPQLAAGMGPIVITRLKDVLDDAGQEPRWHNALLALADIAQRYQGTRGQIEDLFMNQLAAKYDAIDPQTKDAAKLERLSALTMAFCAIQSDRSLNLVFKRIDQPDGRVHTKVKLIRTVADKLDRDLAIEFLQQLNVESMSPMLARAVGGALSDLADADGDSLTVAAATPPPRAGKRQSDGRQGTLGLSDEHQA